MSDSISIGDLRKKGDKAPAKPLKERWWKCKVDGDGKSVSDTIAARVKQLQQQQSARVMRAIVSARLYGNASLAGVSGFNSSQMTTQGGALKERVTDNVIQSVVDTATARIGENKPRPYFITSGGSYKLQRQAKRLNQFVEGIFFEQKAYEMGGDAQRDAGIFGDGLIHIGKRADRVHHTRVLSAECWVDEAEGLYGKPREFHWVRAVDRDELAALYPKKEALISRAARAPFQETGSVSAATDMVIVCESWHLKSGPDAEDGKHSCSIDGGVVLEEDWEHAGFPFAFFKWAPRPIGYWAQGIAERLQNKQLEINKLLWVMQRSMHMAGSYKIFLEDGSKVVKEHVTNDIGAIITFRGTPPTWFVPQVVPGEYYQHLQTLISSCYEREGVSLQSATGVKPSGLNSGEAQRVYRDTVNERLKTQERLNERGYMDLAAWDIAIARDIAKDSGGKYKVETIQKRSTVEVEMTAAELEDGDWKLQCFPTSSLPRDPAGRLETIQEYIQAGFMTPRQGRRALDFPDLDAIESLANAEEDLLTKMLDAICDDGKMTVPEPTDDLQLGKELVVEYINRGRMLDLSDDRLDMLRAWSAQLDALQEQAQAAMAPPPGAGAPGMGPPQAVPTAPPVSNLLPNAPQAAA